MLKFFPWWVIFLWIYPFTVIGIHPYLVSVNSVSLAPKIDPLPGLSSSKRSGSSLPVFPLAEFGFLGKLEQELKLLSQVLNRLVLIPIQNCINNENAKIKSLLPVKSSIFRSDNPNIKSSKLVSAISNLQLPAKFNISSDSYNESPKSNSIKLVDAISDLLLPIDSQFSLCQRASLNFSAAARPPSDVSVQLKLSSPVLVFEPIPPGSIQTFDNGNFPLDSGPHYQHSNVHSSDFVHFHSEISGFLFAGLPPIRSYFRYPHFRLNCQVKCDSVPHFSSRSLNLVWLNSILTSNNVSTLLTVLSPSCSVGLLSLTSFPAASNATLDFPQVGGIFYWFRLVLFWSSYPCSGFIGSGSTSSGSKVSASFNFSCNKCCFDKSMMIIVSQPLWLSPSMPSWQNRLGNTDFYSLYLRFCTILFQDKLNRLALLCSFSSSQIKFDSIPKLPSNSLVAGWNYLASVGSSKESPTGSYIMKGSNQPANQLPLHHNAISSTSLVMSFFLAMSIVILPCLASYLLNRFITSIITAKVELPVTPNPHQVDKSTLFQSTACLSSPLYTKVRRATLHIEAHHDEFLSEIAKINYLIQQLADSSVVAWGLDEIDNTPEDTIDYFIFTHRLLVAHPGGIHNNNIASQPQPLASSTSHASNTSLHDTHDKPSRENTVIPLFADDNCDISKEQEIPHHSYNTTYPSVSVKFESLLANPSFSDVNLHVLFDIEAQANFMSLYTARKLGLPLTPRSPGKQGDGSDLLLWKVPLVEFYLDGLLLSDEFLVVENLPSPVVLGFTWMFNHMVNIDYSKEKLFFFCGGKQHQKYITFAEVPLLNTGQFQLPQEAVVMLPDHLFSAPVEMSASSQSSDTENKLVPYYPVAFSQVVPYHSVVSFHPEASEFTHTPPDDMETADLLALYPPPTADTISLDLPANPASDDPILPDIKMVPLADNNPPRLSDDHALFSPHDLNCINFFVDFLNNYLGPKVFNPLRGGDVRIHDPDINYCGVINRILGRFYCKSKINSLLAMMWGLKSKCCPFDFELPSVRKLISVLRENFHLHFK